MKSSRIKACYALLGVLLLALIILNILIGSSSMTMGDALKILFSHDTVSKYGKIVWDIRMPRILAAALLGGALSVSGFLLQTFFANPIAGPYILGISSGAKLVVACAMIFALSHGMMVHSLVMIIAAFAGSLVVTGVILLISGKVKSMAVLIVCGVMVGYICSAITEFLVTFADDSNIVNLHNWSMGSFSAVSWDNIRVITLVVLIAVVVSFLLSKPMNAFQMGEQYAVSVGVNLRSFRIGLITLSSILSATVTAFAGPISFVGIAVPHIIRSITDTSKPVVMIPQCFLGGSVFCLFCDLLARSLFAPTEMSISSMTAVFGAPVVIAKVIVAGAEIVVQPGEIVTLIGPNGAGKSTVLKTIAGQLEPIAGTIYIGDEERSTYSLTEIAKKQAVMLTERNPAEKMTCEEVISLGRYPYTGRLGILSENDKKIVRDTMELVHVTELAERSYDQISDGQRQRVLLARAICQEPEIMILDEPTSYLDIRHKLEFLDLLRSLTQEKEIGVIMSMHELELAHLIADKVICISADGKVEKVGSPEEVFTDELISRLYSLGDGRLREVYAGFVKSIEKNG